MAERVFAKKLKTISGDFIHIETMTYSNGGRTEFYEKDETAIIIDFGICNPPLHNEKAFDYFLITEKQNFYMNRYSTVFRFLSDDILEINTVLKESDNFDMEKYFKKSSHAVRENASPSPLEFSFEDNFAAVYGSNSLKYLFKEYEICDSNGNSFFLDYLVKSKTWTKAVEENGIHYHHPQFIGTEKYKKQLHKQNVCALWGIKLFRFSTEDCQFTERIQDDIRSFFGTTSDIFIENSLLSERQFQLYEHQENTLKEIQKKRKSGFKSFLIVFPTASGKSKIVEEDIKDFEKSKNDFSALILVPNNAVKCDWTNRIKQSLKTLKSKIEIQTYSYAVRHYSENSSDHYNYIVVDEAHHAVATMLRRVIQYYTPDFLVGLTATDQRPDKKELEDVFGSYETELSLEEAMKQKIIATARVFRVETNINLSTVRINGKDYVNADLEKSIRVTSRNELIAQILKRYFSSDGLQKLQGVIFCVNVQHTIEMAKILNEHGLNAAPYTNRNSNSEEIMRNFTQKKIRFLCSCNMISEGWDYPELGILVMARPTLSKVLYLQQIGRGLRKTPSKNDVFVIDVVDEYGCAIVPCSMHSIFHCEYYVPFGSIIKNDYKVGDFIEVDGLVERIERIIQIDTTSFEEKYGNYLSQEQTAREYFVSTGTITSWLKKGKIKADARFQFGSKTIFLFSPENVEKIKIKLGIKEHNDDTIRDDFFEFLAERDYSLSYKMPFLLGFIKNLNSIGDAKIDDILDYYIRFYKLRIMRGQIVDKRTCPYTKTLLENRKEIQRSMLTNPFEKFERKRFMYYSKDLGMISMNHALFSKLNKADFEQIEKQMNEDLKNYYKELGSEHIAEVEYKIQDNLPLMVADSGTKE
ncbi:MAG: DEAD/DEAH box helicase [Treponemataceae bacterium]|nr:DEAD/DEAH box helicase [Treponemataceae bacterium]